MKTLTNDATERDRERVEETKNTSFSFTWMRVQNIQQTDYVEKENLNRS